MNRLHADHVPARLGLGAVIASMALALVLAPTALAAPPDYSISVDKTADPSVVPAGGATVTYTVTVENTGSGFFQVVTVEDGDCSLTGPAHDTGDEDDKLEAGEIWSYTCTVDDVTPGHLNTVTVNACHDGSVEGCNNESHDATGEAEATVTEATPAPTAEPTATEAPTLPPTDMVGGPAGTTDGLGLALTALAGVLVMTLMIRPARARRG